MKALRFSLALMLLVASVSARADDPKSDKDKTKEARPEKRAITLKVGDPAPALKVSEWLQGEPVTHFEPGKVYVVEFWATWCGPCIAMMPHTADLQAEFKDQGVTIISYTGKDPDNSLDKVVEFVKKRGAKLTYAFAYNEGARVWDGWMKDAGKNGIPCAFVIDKSGRIAYIGHPIFLGAVLPMAIAGEPPRAINEEVEKIKKDWTAATRLEGKEDPDKIRAALKSLSDIEAKYPGMANMSHSISAKLRYLPKIGNIEETKRVAAAAMTKAEARDDQSLLGTIAFNLRESPAKENKELVAIAVRASEAKLHLAGDNNVPALIDLSKSYSAAGDNANAAAALRKASQNVGDKEVPLLIELSESYRAAGDNANAAAALRKASQNVGDKEVPLLTMVANAYIAIGDKPEAKKFAEKAGKAVDDKAWSQLFQLAKTYSALGDKAETGKYGRRALAAVPEEAPRIIKSSVETQLRKLDLEKQEEKK